VSAAESVRVLLVEDNPADARLVAELLREGRSQYDIEHHASLSEALAALADGSFDLMLLDLSLPDTSGFETLKRAHQAAPHLPIVVMTGLEDEQLAERAVQSAAQDYLLKSELSGRLLERAIRYAIGRGRTLVKLRESEERLALAMRGAKDGLWDWSLEDDVVYYSERWKDIVGLVERGHDGHPDEWFDRVHADDVARVRAELEDHVQGNTAAFESEYRMLHRDGGYRWVLTRGLAVRGADDGRAYRLAGSQTDITKRKLAEEQLKHQALHDRLTGLPNRTLLLERVERALIRSEPNGERARTLFGVLVVQLDNYDGISGSFGHVVADRWIEALARRFARRVRDRTHTLARVARDRFAWLVEDAGDVSTIVEVAKDLQESLEQPVALEGEELFTTASTGITTSDAGYRRAEEYLRDAEVAMNRARADGGARERVFDAPMHQNVLERLQIEKELRRAIERDEMEMHYQPVVWLETGEVAGFEALVRWQHPERGMLAPFHFLPVAEETGMLSAIFFQLLPKVLEQLTAWHEEFSSGPPLFLNLNLSPKEVMDPGLLDAIDAALQRHPMPPFALGIEMTESMIIEDDAKVASVLQQLKARHFRLLLDDFGTGYSSMSCLQHFPIDTLKIDKSFIAQTGGDGNSEIVRAIVSLAHTLGMKVTAEGIETPEQLQVVETLGCELGQGYFFSRPLPALEATKAIAKGYDVGMSGATTTTRSSRPPASTRVSRGRILLVDDDRASRNLMRLQLEEQGFEVVTAASGQECISLAVKIDPEVIMLDIEMPGMDGVETCRRLKKATDTRALPVLFITGRREDDPTTIEALAAGGNDFLSKDAPIPVLCARLGSQIAIARAHGKLRRLSMNDELTGVFTRRFLFEALRRAVKSMSRRCPASLSFMLADVDRFKDINDAFGHIEGDRVLAQIAATIDQQTRETDLVARFGGEEFVVVLPDTHHKGGLLVAEKIRAAVEAQGSNTLSIGLAHLEVADAGVLKVPGEVDRIVAELIRTADEAMYRAKREGRNRVVAIDLPVASSG
jgi:diguanylate cyclase (GGDEF)-like protein/PAS domain S-box-containing protein